ncbi:thymocyte selection-associated high mobility group box protein TOX-like, partial [Pollicipes pollicipes]|uniref:thymocyte selection-associated high mobility group box protein TOX-like n=1 Tax=Pollicipes pollicipes TaxID=41117 RepID=UPI0018859F4D
MEAYCVGPDHANRIFDAYPYKAPDSFDLSLNIPSGGLYAMSEQSYQPPSLGDEEFELPPLMSDGVGHGGQQGGMYSPAMEMSMPMTSTVDTMTSGGYHPHHPHQQQHHHMYYGQEGDLYHPGPPQQQASPQQQQQQQQFQQRQPQHPGMYMQHDMMNHHQIRPPMYQGAGHGLMGPPSGGSPGQVNNSPGHTTSEDSSDDSTPLAQWIRTKRPSPEPAALSAANMKPAKKPKAPKKKKKRDPNEPQKPVSAYALFFRDTQAAIKGQNPHASFGEVSKIVASMWDGLNTDDKNVYKKKTENAKKEYLKALAAYRASLISKTNSEEQQQPAAGMFSGYGGYPNTPFTTGGYPTPYTGSGAALAKKSPLLTSLMSDGHQPQQEMLGGSMAPPSLYPPAGLLGGPGYHAAGPAPTGQMMPPASQPLYMHHQVRAARPPAGQAAGCGLHGTLQQTR